MEKLFDNNTELKSHSDFDPYDFNGGTILAIAGENFSIIASDTRISSGYTIHNRNEKKLWDFKSSGVLGIVGFHADAKKLALDLQCKVEVYEYEHMKPMSVNSFAHLLSTELYTRRFFPYYTYPILAGLDENNKGVVYSTDVVGSLEKTNWCSAGSGSKAVLPYLDSTLGNFSAAGEIVQNLNIEKSINLTKEAFYAAAERDIYTGDSLDICLITPEGNIVTNYPLRSD